MYSARGSTIRGRIIATNSTRWQPPAAYLYVLRLTGPSLAWEYLRRNLEYNADWARRHHKHVRNPASHWHLEILENPALDARVARPVWRLGGCQRVRLQAAGDTTDDPQRFSLWTISGPKRLIHDGSHVLLTGFVDSEMLHLALSHDVHDGVPFDYVLSQGTRAVEALQSIETQQRLLAGQAAPAPAASSRPDRLALFHMRALQALDGRDAGASLRDIATRLFGEDMVAKNWHPDSDLRAQVRHMIRRARALAVGGYRGLIC